MFLEGDLPMAVGQWLGKKEIALHMKMEESTRASRHGSSARLNGIQLEVSDLGVFLNDGAVCLAGRKSILPAISDSNRKL